LGKRKQLVHFDGTRTRTRRERQEQDQRQQNRDSLHTYINARVIPEIR
jgi:hypothetical protein